MSMAARGVGYEIRPAFRAKSRSRPAGRRRLYRLARSANLWERRTAIVATAYFIRQGQLDDTFRIAELLLTDEHDLIHKPTGGWLRDAGTHDRDRLLRFLDRYATTMPRTALRYAIEHLDAEQRRHYLALKPGAHEPGRGRRASAKGSGRRKGSVTERTPGS